MWHHVIFDYNVANKDKNMFMENVKKLSQHIATSAVIKYGAPGVAKAVRKLVAPKFNDPPPPTGNANTRLQAINKFTNKIPS